MAVLSLSAFFSSATAGEVEPPSEPIEVLKVSLGSPCAVSYSGHRVEWYQQEDGSRCETTCRVWRTADGREKTVVSLGDAIVRILIRHGRDNWSWVKGRDYWTSGPPSGGDRRRWDNIELLSRNYVLTRDDTYYMERRSIVIHAESQSPGRPTLKAVVDASTMLPLVVEVMRPGGRDSFGYRFQDVSFKPVEDSLFDLPAEYEIRADEPVCAGDGSCPPGDAAAVPFRMAVPERVPAGFALTECSVLNQPGSQAGDKTQVVRLTYADGLSVISVYVTAGGSAGGAFDPELTEVRRAEKTVMWKRCIRDVMLTTSVADTNITVFGEIPLEELLDMSFSLKPVE